jgi:hypothetical protein
MVTAATSRLRNAPGTSPECRPAVAPFIQNGVDLGRQLPQASRGSAEVDKGDKALSCPHAWSSRRLAWLPMNRGSESYVDLNRR